MKPITTIAGRAVVLSLDDVDTDQIIPARFLTTTAKDGLGAHLFADWRFDGAGRPRPDFILNKPEAADAPILIAGRNFGCGSSREHAPWALRDFGFRAVIATSFADIFRGNALKVGLLPIAMSDADHRTLVSEVQRDAAMRLTVDLAQQTVEMPPPGGFRCVFPLDRFAKHCLLDGVDELGFLLAADNDIAAYERGHMPAVRTIE